MPAQRVNSGLPGPIGDHGRAQQRDVGPRGGADDSIITTVLRGHNEADERQRQSLAADVEIPTPRIGEGNKIRRRRHAWQV